MVEQSSVQSPVTRALTFARGGLTPTVVVLAVLFVGAAACGFWLRPDTGIPQPASSSVEIDFSPERPARSPVTVGLRLLRDRPTHVGDRATVTLAIDLNGEDFTYPGWTVVAVVPTGVRVNGAQGDDPGTGLVGRFSDTMATVVVAPGSVSGGSYTALLIWDDVDHGPIQVRGANLVAAFPDVTVENHTRPGATDGSSVPRPEVTVQRELVPRGDYAFLGGLPPDRLAGLAWSWKPETGHINEGDAAPALKVETRSATADDESHNAEFESGIAFGIAAAALIAGIQEFMNR